jgi:hypothetical protein
MVNFLSLVKHQGLIWGQLNITFMCVLKKGCLIIYAYVSFVDLFWLFPI